MARTGPKAVHTPPVPTKKTLEEYDKRERGKGRKSSLQRAAQAAGDKATFEATTPPSQRSNPKCGVRLPDTVDEFCLNPKGQATDHPGYGACSKHGGRTQAGVKAAMREMGREVLMAYKTQNLRFGGDRRDPSIASLTPEQALIEEVRRSAAMVRFLEERIAQWNLDPVQEATVEAFVTHNRANEYRRNKFQDVRTITMTQLAEEFLDSLSPDDPDSSQKRLPALTIRDEKTGLSNFTDAREWLYLYREERMHLAKVSKMTIDAGVAQRLVTIAEDQGRILASAIKAVLRALNLSPEQASQVPIIVPQILRAVATDQPIPDISSLPPAS